MSVDKIIKEIEKSANEKIKSIKSNTIDQIKEIKKDSEKKGLEIYNEILLKGNFESDALSNRIQSVARMNSKKIVMDTKSELISDCFNESLLQLKEIPTTSAYEDILVKYIQNGMDMMELTDVIVECNKKDAPIVKKIASNMSGKLLSVKVSKNHIDSIGGIIIKSKDDSMFVNNTFEEIIRRKENEIRYGVSKILYGGN
ncbi:MAG: V-type ATP synthase subunit E [Methanosarcinaceae archaeon]|nr:V-type ATP synthase subunit E [Methanosarcinaceae archaeon]